MEFEVEFGPEDLALARLGADLGAVHEICGHLVGVPSIGLRLDPCVDHFVSQARVKVGDVGGQRPKTFRSRHEPAGAAQTEASFGAGGSHRDGPPLTDTTEHVFGAHPGVVEEEFGEARLAVEAADRPPFHPRRLGGHEEIGESLVALGLRVGAHDAEDPVGEGTTGAPGLLSVEDEVVAVEDRLGLDAGKVGARFGLAPALGPDVFTTRHPRQEEILLFLGAEVEDRGRKQADTVGADPTGHARQPVLLFVDQPLDQVAVTAAVHRGPGRYRPASVEQDLLPRTVFLEADGRIHRGDAAGMIVGQPLAAFVAEGDVLR